MIDTKVGGRIGGTESWMEREKGPLPSLQKKNSSDTDTNSSENFSNFELNCEQTGQN